MRNRTGIWALLVLVVLVLPLVFWYRGQASERAGGQTITFYQEIGPCGLDPARVADGASARVMANIFENLVRYKEGSTEIEPGLATAWDVSPDGREWTFKLRKGVKFHDGTPFNARAVKFSVERQLPPNRTDDMPYAAFTFGPVERVEAVDDHTVKFILKKPYAPFPANLAMCPAAPIVSPAAVAKHGEDFRVHPVGTGPYRFVAWDRGRQIVLERNPDYWGEPPATQRIVFKFSRDYAARLGELIRGSVDAMDGVNPQDVKKLEDKGVKVIKEPGMNVNYFAFFCDRPPFDNVKLRRAVSMAIDRQRLAARLYRGSARAANGPLPPFVPGYDPKLKPLPYNPEKARA
ncbi:MAG TPA: ABC transporter substrate-binding protein, partial [Peptococcaceae bacterium]|nr:ABC transporter substrate-binding protein [Peptococcaceae bacterium]